MKENVFTFESYSGKKIAGNPKAIYEYIKSNYNNKFRLIFFVNKGVSFVGVDSKDIVYKWTFKWLYYTRISKVWVKNTGRYGSLPKRKSQKYFQTWHGAGTLKKMGYDLEQPESNKSRKPKKNTKGWDYLISANFEKDKILRRCTGYSGSGKILGYPRNDLLLNFSDSKIDSIKIKFGIGHFNKIILYAPTFREERMCELDNLEVPSDMILLIKHHPLAKYDDIKLKSGNFIDLTDYNDINDLLLISDVLITDYSSTIWDYAILNKPMCFFAYDYQSYNNERGFYINYMDEVPGNIVTSIIEFTFYLNNLDEINYNFKNKLLNFRNKYCYLDDGYASKRVTEYILEKIIKE